MGKSEQVSALLLGRTETLFDDRPKISDDIILCTGIAKTVLMRLPPDTPYNIPQIIAVQSIVRAKMSLTISPCWNATTHR